MKRFITLFLFLGIVLIGPVAYATTIDLDAVFETAENDGVIHFGDQTISDFVDDTVDYANYVQVTKTFTLTEQALSGGTFGITIDHYGSSFVAGYSNYFAINGTSFDILHDSDGLTGDHDVDLTWYTQTFSGANSLLNLGSNTIDFYIDSKSSNQDDFEITNFSLSYVATQSGGPTVPEPTTMTLFGLGLLGLAGVSRKKNNS